MSNLTLTEVEADLLILRLDLTLYIQDAQEATLWKAEPAGMNPVTVIATT